MKLQDCRDKYYKSTAKASELSRQLGFAAIAVIWIFKTEASGSMALPTGLLFAAALVVAGLAFDFLQYVSMSVVWGLYSRRKEKSKFPEDAELDLPPMINWPAIFFFWLKIVLICLAYVFIIGFLFRKLT